MIRHRTTKETVTYYDAKRMLKGIPPLQSIGSIPMNNFIGDFINKMIRFFKFFIILSFHDVNFLIYSFVGYVYRSIDVSTLFLL
jgi:hypothetical protein